MFRPFRYRLRQWADLVISDFVRWLRINSEKARHEQIALTRTEISRLIKFQ